MLSIHTARDPGPKQRHPRIGLAIAGGGPVGAMYELGVLRALEEACDGLELTRLDGYVGVSSGAFFAAGLANRMDTAELCRIFLKGECTDASFSPEIFLQPAFREYLKRAAAAPRQGLRLLHDLVTPDTGSRWSELLNRLGGLIPTGLFDNAPIERFLRELFSHKGRSNDFRKLKRPLFVIAVDLDSSETTCFGGPGWDDVPISSAVQASSALPGLYPPVELRGRNFVDGALRRTMHASILLERDVDLLIGINPLVPFNPTREAGQTRYGDRQIAQAGLPGVLSQTLRTMLQSRMQVGLARYPQQYPHINQVVFEPNAIDRELFYTNIFSFSARQRISQLGYRNTLDDLRNRRELLEPLLARHGIGLREEVLADHGRVLLDVLPAGVRRTETTARLARNLDDIEHLLQRVV
ncbi:patatin-like phospholipase family protein [Thermomonas sp.]|uniref:patatin-like phospholipase family protein n=1 Tax=Thermomonas sp. TaxID=1971895 RepID=UPI001DE925AF|nr:patatin-like phospholipase family protein [Thermomonas sp.]MBZ0086841.1 patatin-like phospholipase family protein [Thermomonas sp.]HRO62865.1 patatin-like phospholipase family protein [Thermomonas sp.]